MNWEQVVQKVTPYILKIETPAGHGTGFLCLYNDTKTFCGVATALHVVEYADTWKQPIRLTHHLSSEQLFLKDPEHIIITDGETDSAVILFQKPAFELPSELIEFLPLGTPLSIGNEVSWLGFPSIEPSTLCFFSGNISAWQDFRKTYLIDGVAINGVSGGPVLYVKPMVSKLLASFLFIKPVVQLAMCFRVCSLLKTFLTFMVLLLKFVLLMMLIKRKPRLNSNNQRMIKKY